MTQEELKVKLTEWRHYLHAHPETAFEETNTAAFVAEKLREMGLTVHEHIGGTGVVADLKVGDGPQVIGLRADMDAINLKETTGLPYQSLNPGKMHGCGHDGHITWCHALTFRTPQFQWNCTLYLPDCRRTRKRLQGYDR